METNEARQYKSLKAMPFHVVSKSIKHFLYGNVWGHNLNSINENSWAA